MLTESTRVYTWRSFDLQQLLIAWRQNKGPTPFRVEPFTSDSAGHTGGSLTVFPRRFSKAVITSTRSL